MKNGDFGRFDVFDHLPLDRYANDRGAQRILSPRECVRLPTGKLPL
jgi:hypothetical protein